MKAALVSKEKVEALNKQELALREREADIKREMEVWLSFHHDLVGLEKIIGTSFNARGAKKS